MNPMLKPIKTLNIISFALHAAAILFTILIVLFRYQITTYFYSHLGFEGGMPLPSAFVALPIIVSFAVHAVLAALFHNAIQSNSELKTLSVISLILKIIVIPLFSYILAYFAAFFHARHGFDYLTAQSILQSFISFAMIPRMFGIPALLACAAISLYYTYYCKTQQKNY